MSANIRKGTFALMLALMGFVAFYVAPSIASRSRYAGHGELMGAFLLSSGNAVVVNLTETGELEMRYVGSQNDYSEGWPLPDVPQKAIMDVCNDRVQVVVEFPYQVEVITFDLPQGSNRLCTTTTQVYLPLVESSSE